MSPHTTSHGPQPVPALPGAVGAWTLRPAPAAPVEGGLTLPAPAAGTARAYTALRGGCAPAFQVEIQRVLSHPLRGCYPVGAHDLLLAVIPLAPQPEPDAVALLDALTQALFGADPRCRRVMAAPDVADVPALERYTAGRFRTVAEADLHERTVTLMVVEPPQVMEVSTALDDMPH
ncbi:GNAT family N-acetyltransferase [Streptomyces sp. NPDC018000]|uniref:GNAT family N-acetyltransferase n=1 Tax=Streptomyces sp. NPDC018000 TaxID=3365028 RepID=UPI0037BD9757